jgi:hypothetical protein
LPVLLAGLSVVAVSLKNVVSRGGSTETNENAIATYDAAPADAAPADATPADAASLDAAIPIDAGKRKRRIDAAIPRPRGKGTLRVGVKPWAVVFLDGRELGQAPKSWQVPAGRHRVEVRFPPKSLVKKYTVTIEADDTKYIGLIDFTAE